MEYKIIYIATDAYDFIAAENNEEKECIKIMDDEYFPYFKKNGEYDIMEIDKYFKKIEDISSWREIEGWYTIEDIKEDCQNYEIIYEEEKEI